MEHGFFHPERGYWQTLSTPSEEVLAAYPPGTVEIPVQPGNGYVWDGSEWVYAPLPTPAEHNKAEAQRRLTVTDWVNQPDVYDPANTPHLTNRDAFIAYRSQIRAIAINSIEGDLDWPVEPTASWSS
jgi:hypothetical protein